MSEMLNSQVYCNVCFFSEFGMYVEKDKQTTLLLLTNDGSWAQTEINYFFFCLCRKVDSLKLM